MLTLIDFLFACLFVSCAYTRVVVKIELTGLMPDMVKNKGFLSTGPMEVQKQRKQIKLIVNSLLAPCVEPAEGSDVPFNTQVIIANPPVYGTLQFLHFKQSTSLK
jgi:hypothetical protein